MEILDSLAILLGTVLKTGYFLYSLFLAHKDQYQKATYCLALSFFFLVSTDSLK